MAVICFGTHWQRLMRQTLPISSGPSECRYKYEQLWTAYEPHSTTKSHSSEWLFLLLKFLKEVSKMPYDITKYEPGYGGTIDSSGNVKNIADSIDASGNFKVAGSFSVTPSGTQTINNAVVTATMQNAATATGNGTTLNTTNQAMAVLDVQGTFVGTIIIEATIDGTNYFTIKTTDMSSDTRVSSITAPGQFSLRTSGYQNVRARISAYTSGSITVYGRAVAGGISHHTAAITNTPTFSQGGVDTTQAYKQATLQNAATAIGVGSYIEVSGYAGLQMEITISGTATVTVQYSNDLSNWYSLNNTKGNATASSTTQVFFNTFACRYVRANITAYTSGTVTVVATATQGFPTFGQQFSTYGNADSSSLLSTNMATVANVGLLYNNSTWDRARNNLVGTGLASAARTSTTNSADFTNYNHRGIILSLNVTVASGSGGLQIQIQAKDTIASAYKAINTLPTAITATGQYIYMIYPGIDTVSNNNAQNVSQVLPQIFRISVTHGDSSSYTYSVNYHMIM